MNHAFCRKKTNVDFVAPDLSSVGTLALLHGSDCDFLDKIADDIPTLRKLFLIQHTMRELVRRRVGQIMCGNEEANDSDSMRHDSLLKINLRGHSAETKVINYTSDTITAETAKS